MTRVWIVAFVSLVCATSARAQDCAEGRERVAGRCCWPAQTWSEERARCEGAPHCPDGLVEHGDACIAAASGAPAATGVPALTAPTGYGDAALTGWAPPPTAVSTEGWPLAEGSPMRPTARAFRWRGEDEPLIMFAMSIFDVGWLMGWIGVIVDEAMQSCATFFGFGPSGRHSCQSSPLAGVPLVGGLLASILTFDGSRQNFTSLGHGVTSLILQLVGIIAIPIALANETSETVFQPLELGDDATATIDLSAPGSDAGVSATLRF